MKKYFNIIPVSKSAKIEIEKEIEIAEQTWILIL